MKRVLLALLLFGLLGIGAEARRRFIPKPVTSSLLTVTDNFHRGPQDPITGANLTMSDGVGVWVNGPGAMNNVGIASNTLTSTGSQAGCVVSNTFAAHQKSSATMDASTGSVVNWGVSVRGNTSNGNCYLAFVDDTTHIAIYKVADSGSLGFTLLATVVLGAAFTNTDTLGVEASGTTTTTLTVYINGVAQPTTGSDSSSAYTSGQPGIYFSNNGRNLASFTGNEL